MKDLNFENQLQILNEKVNAFRVNIVIGVNDPSEYSIGASFTGQITDKSAVIKGLRELCDMMESDEFEVSDSELS